MLIRSAILLILAPGLKGLNNEISGRCSQRNCQITISGGITEWIEQL